MAVSGAHKVCPQKNALRRDHISPILLIPRLAYHRSSPRARRARANYMRDSRQHVDRPSAIEYAFPPRINAKFRSHPVIFASQDSDH